MFCGFPALPIPQHPTTLCATLGTFRAYLPLQPIAAGLDARGRTCASMLPATGRAYSPEQEQACSGDAVRLCSPEIPDVDRITACMIRNKAQLSPGCRVFFRPEPEASVTAVAAGGPLRIRPFTSRSRSAPGRANRKRRPGRAPTDRGEGWLVLLASRQAHAPCQRPAVGAWRRNRR